MLSHHVGVSVLCPSSSSVLADSLMMQDEQAPSNVLPWRRSARSSDPTYQSSNLTQPDRTPLSQFSRSFVTMVPHGNFPNSNLEMPALAPPPGVVPNFIDPPTNRSAIFAVFITCLVIMTLAVTIRMYTKILMLKKLAIEDCKSTQAFHVYPLTVFVDLVFSALVSAL
jgi:hypothetical protein